MLNKHRAKVIVSWLLVAVWLILIFNFSAQPAQQSNSLSTGVTEKVVKAAKVVTHSKDLNMENVNHVIRKCAHFLNYFILGILVLNALALSNSRQLKWKNVLFAILICALYAGSDEFHQIFVPGRGPQIKDVFIDSSGSLAGIVIYEIIIGAVLVLRSRTQKSRPL